MRSEEDIKTRVEDLKKAILHPSTKKMIRDDYVITMHALEWVLEEKEDRIADRLRMLNILDNPPDNFLDNKIKEVMPDEKIQ